MRPVLSPALSSVLSRTVLCSLLSSALFATSAHGAEDARQLGAFRAIAIHGPINIEVRAGQVVIDNVREERLDLQFEGAGRLEAKGSAKWLRLKARGVGEVTTQHLKADRADVNFEGIGDVKVHASQTLNAVVRGMGSLTYFGKPKSLNKSVSGIGSVSAGD